MPDINVDLTGKDNLSPALKNASARLAELRTEIDRIRAKGEINLTVADTKNLTRLTSEANRLEKALGGVQSQTSRTSDVFTTLGKALPYAAIASFAVKAGETLFNLNAMREESAQLEARFVGFTGGVQQASNALNAMDNALGNALSRDQKMAAATQLLGLGLAKTAQEAADLTNNALILGMSVEQLTQALETGQSRGLVQYGISLQDVRARAEELQKANTSLTDAEARSIAIKEQVAAKADAIAAAGGRAATSTQEMKNAFDTLKDSVADFVNLEAGINGVTLGMTRLSEVLGTIQDLKMSMDTTDAEAQILGITARLEYLRDLIARSESGENIYRFNAENARKEIADLENRLLALPAANEAAGSSAGVAAIRMVDAAIQVEGAIAGVDSALTNSSTYWDRWAAFAENAAQRASNAAWAARSAMGQAAEAATTTGTFTEPSKTRGGLWTEWGKHFVDTGAGDLVTEWQDRMTGANKKIATSAASDYQREMKAAATAVQGEIEGALQGAMGASKGLFDLTGGVAGGADIFKPGANGPFENIYRALDVAKLGAASPWAAALGLTQEDARRISADFQKGLFTEDVQKLINIDQLVGQIGTEQAAAESTSKFAQFIASKLGVKDAGALVASQTFQAIAGGVDADPAVQAESAKRVLDTYINNVQEVVKGKDYAGKMIGFGQSTWVYYEQGLLEGAATSSVFNAAIDAAIAAFMQRGTKGTPTANPVMAATAAGGITLP